MCVRKQHIEYVIVWICINCPESNRGLYYVYQNVNSTRAMVRAPSRCLCMIPSTTYIYTCISYTRHTIQTEKHFDCMCRHNNYLFSYLKSHIFPKYKQNVLKSVTYLSMHKPLAKMCTNRIPTFGHKDKIPKRFQILDCAIKQLNTNRQFSSSITTMPQPYTIYS